MRLYNQLDTSAKTALNLAFLTNIKSGRNHQTFHQAMEAFQNEVADKRKSALDQIFPASKFARNRSDNSKSNVVVG